MKWCTGLSLLISLVLVGGAETAQIQYRVSTGEVTGVRDEPPIPDVSGYGVVVIPEPMSDIQWPVPSGCAAGSGQSVWTRLSDPGAVTVSGGGMAVRPEIATLFFVTSSPLLPGCHRVHTWAELRTLVEQAVIDAVKARELVGALNELNVAVQVRCPTLNVSATCTAARTKMADLNSTAGTYPTEAALDTFLGQVQDLRDDALAFRAARAW